MSNTDALIFAIVLLLLCLIVLWGIWSAEIEREDRARDAQLRREARAQPPNE